MWWGWSIRNQSDRERMIVTARQLQDLQGIGQSNDQIVLPYGARLTPLALDWARSKRLKIGYGPREMADSKKAAKTETMPTASPCGANTLLWWCDGPCGAAKAALSAQARESSLTPIDLPSESTQLTGAIKRLAFGVKGGHAGGGVLLVKSAADAIVFANRCPSLRAIVGTCLESVDQGIVAVAANVLVLEYPYKSLSQIRNMLSRFARGTRNPSEDTQRRLQELIACV
jgi:hypothetical protein